MGLVASARHLERLIQMWLIKIAFTLHFIANFLYSAPSIMLFLPTIYVGVLVSRHYYNNNSFMAIIGQLEDFVGAKFYCCMPLMTGTSTF